MIDIDYNTSDPKKMFNLTVTELGAVGDKQRADGLIKMILLEERREPGGKCIC